MKIKEIKVILPVFLGALLEWYDFSVYVFFAPLLSSLFFPAENKLISTLMTYAVFAIGFVIRPLGGAFWGRYGDNYGRKRSMLLSMMLITISTLFIGLL